MRYTNKHNFPKYVEEWLSNDEYDYEDNTISATTLMSPPRMWALKKLHWEDLEMDIADLIASRYGTALHDSVEKTKISNAIQEQRFRTKIDGKVITGKFDLMIDMDKSEKKLVDIKSTSVWTHIYGSRDEDYKTQMSIYRFLARKNGHNVGTKAEIMMVFTDWSASKARKDPEYPQSRILIKPVDLWSDEETEEYIKGRIKALEDAEIDPPNCTEEELWQDKTKYAVMKKGRISAVKLHDSQEASDEHMLSLSEDHYVEVRQGKVKRCNYCSARTVCAQYTALKSLGLIEE